VLVRADVICCDGDACSDAVWYARNKTLSLLCFADYPGFFWGRQLTANVTAAACRYYRHCYISISICTTTALLPFPPSSSRQRRKSQNQKIKLRSQPEPVTDGTGMGIPTEAYSHWGGVSFARTSTCRNWGCELDCAGSALCQIITEKGMGTPVSCSRSDLV